MSLTYEKMMKSYHVTKKINELCNVIISKHLSKIECLLGINAKVEILEKVKSEHFNIGKSRNIEGVICSREEIITIYPQNIYFNHCGLLPEPFKWAVFEENVVRVLSHELRHLWQIKNNLFYKDNAELDADEFANEYQLIKEKNNECRNY